MGIIGVILLVIPIVIGIGVLVEAHKRSRREKD
jgi:hypothetical protein